jgi:hypothetical protein
MPEYHVSGIAAEPAFTPATAPLLKLPSYWLQLLM